MSESIVLPVRFIQHGYAVQTTTRALTPEDVEICCPMPPPAGARVMLRLYLPDAPPVESEAVVLRSLPGSFQARFAALGEEARRSLRDLVRRLQPPPNVPRNTQGHDSRAHARVKARVRVRFAAPGDLLQHAEDLSAGGMFVAAKGDYQPGDVLRLVLELPDLGAPVEVTARVIRCVSAQEALLAGRKQGVGLQFVGSDDSFRERVDRIIASAASSHVAG